MKNLKKNKPKLFFSLIFLAFFIWMLFDFFMTTPTKKENIMEQITPSFSASNEIKKIEPLPTEILNNPFDQNLRPFPTNNIGPEYNDPSNWQMRGLIENTQKAWAILSTADDTIFYLNKSNQKI